MFCSNAPGSKMDQRICSRTMPTDGGTTTNYRSRVREMVFKVPDLELRRQIMAKLNSYRSELWDRWEMRRLFDEKFAFRLRSERCRPSTAF
jgi:hypothetical protein